jgi:nitrate/TMAO reductase-like tetraheme cytochrome c subunit
VETPLPSGIGAVVRAAFNAPSWLQILVLAFVAILAGTLIVQLWRRRVVVRRRLSAQPRWMKLVFLGLAAVMVLGAAGVATATWNYTQHNNDFCVSCHVMGNAWTRFQQSEHSTLGCHDCHLQPLSASIRQLYLWVAERPQEIPPHAKVPTRVCEACHNQERPDSSWQRIIATAGHRVHLQSNDPALSGIQCVTCHGAEVHHFAPVDRTCGQSECHSDIEIRLGNMAGQTAFHCTGCHDYTVPTAELVTTDSARAGLVPARAQCLGCHAMRVQVQHAMRELDPEVEPHGAVCGSCHNPHTQLSPAEAFESCASAACHARADTLTPFHRTVGPRILANCGTCHKSHSWKVRSDDCLACHPSIPPRVPPPL